MKPKDNKHDIIKILLAGSGPAQMEPLRLLLEGHGFSVVVVANGKEALAAASRCKPTLIISDIVMPELDGYGLCQAIKSDNQLKDIPVILLTALADTQDILLGLESKVDNLIRKPYDAEFLLSLLSRIDYVLMNLNLYRRMQTGAEISFGGQRHFITSDRQKILDLLISTHEQPARGNDKLKMLERDLT
ncbi:MAG: response regulator [Nitrosomonadaceae bacterium]|nr:response regulator [Nitrosomonadaceae bacterium]